jgi:hypothetical protein
MKLVVRVVAGLLALAGCAPQARTALAPSPHEPDCSFRSAATCWTIAGRFPAPPDSAPAGALDPPPPLLVTR